MDAEGTMTEFYRWAGHLVGHDRYRLISTQSPPAPLWQRRLPLSLRLVRWRKFRVHEEAYDLSTIHGKKGLGFSAWGAGVLSLAHIVKMNTTTFEVENYTLWCGF